jgi:dienelactone hydrolase
VAPGAQAAPHGPNPTAASIAAATGPFATAQVAAQNVSGFGSATIYYPTDRSQGPYGVVAIAPGFFSWWFQLQWMGPRLASQGFVVVGMDTTTVFDWPALRGQELVAALNNAVADPRLAGIVDGSRRAMIGWSMGGGGTLDQAAANPANLKAAIALAPWELSNMYSTVRVPSLVVTGTADTVATQGGAYYNAIPGEKALVSLAGADHFFPTSANTGGGGGDDLLAEAVGRRRHQVHAVPVPRAAERHGSRRLPEHLSVLTRRTGPTRDAARLARGRRPFVVDASRLAPVRGGASSVAAVGLGGLRVPDQPAQRQHEVQAARRLPQVGVEDLVEAAEPVADGLLVDAEPGRGEGALSPHSRYARSVSTSGRRRRVFWRSRRLSRRSVTIESSSSPACATSVEVWSAQRGAGSAGRMPRCTRSRARRAQRREIAPWVTETVGPIAAGPSRRRFVPSHWPAADSGSGTTRYGDGSPWPSPSRLPSTFGGRIDRTAGGARGERDDGDRRRHRPVRGLRELGDRVPVRRRVGDQRVPQPLLAALQVAGTQALLARVAAGGDVGRLPEQREQRVGEQLQGLLRPAVPVGVADEPAAGDLAAHAQRALHVVEAVAVARREHAELREQLDELGRVGLRRGEVVDEQPGRDGDGVPHRALEVLGVLLRLLRDVPDHRGLDLRRRLRDVLAERLAEAGQRAHVGGAGSNGCRCHRGSRAQLWERAQSGQRMTPGRSWMLESR